MRKPDFIIIGAMKSATSTLHQQLALQPGFFMSDPKEPNYFSDDEQYALGESWYLDLFKGAEASDICGESSTHYTKFPDYPLTLDRMQALLPQCRLIYVLRHPIERLVSHYIHQWTQGVIRCDIGQAITDFPELINYSCYARQLEPYIKAYGASNILITANEALRARPQEQLSRVAKFAGYTSDVRWQEKAPSQNVSSQRFRKFPGYHLLVDSALMAWARRALIPKGLREKVRKQLSMSERPELNEAQAIKLAEVFDQDLSILGRWLGVDISCANFSSVFAEKDFKIQWPADV